VLQSLIAQTTSPELQFRKEEATRAQRNSDREFSEGRRRFDVSQEGGKVPPGFRKTETGFEPIPGGPADPTYIQKSTEAKKPDEKALPAELGARVAMAGKFLDEYPLIREKVEKGGITGPVDAALGQLNMGSQGEIMRKMKSGTDALLRNLTGAGMPDAEARKYVSRYEPQINDNAKTVLSKMDQLQDELRRVEDEAYRGRGGLPKNKAEARQLVKDALDAIGKGAPRDKVMKELKSKHGISFGDF
jgi:hypothetical protein